MNWKVSYTYILLIIVLGIGTITFVYWQAVNNYMFINETFALLLLTGSIITKWTQSDKIRAVIFFLLFLPLFDLLGYSYTVEDGNTATTYHSAHFNGVINPIVVLIFIVYGFINSYVIRKQLRYVFKGSDKDITEKNDREIVFYCNKFNSSTEEEFNKIYKMYREYPYTAQIALDKIKEERTL